VLVTDAQRDAVLSAVPSLEPCLTTDRAAVVPKPLACAPTVPSARRWLPQSAATAMLELAGEI
jgi:hypothetical protein